MLQVASCKLLTLQAYDDFILNMGQKAESVEEQFASFKAQHKVKQDRKA